MPAWTLDPRTVVLDGPYAPYFHYPHLRAYQHPAAGVPAQQQATGSTASASSSSSSSSSTLQPHAVTLQPHAVALQSQPLYMPTTPAPRLLSSSSMTPRLVATNTTTSITTTIASPPPSHAQPQPTAQHLTMPTLGSRLRTASDHLLARAQPHLTAFWQHVSRLLDRLTTLCCAYLATITAVSQRVYLQRILPILSSHMGQLILRSLALFSPFPPPAHLRYAPIYPLTDDAAVQAFLTATNQSTATRPNASMNTNTCNSSSKATSSPPALNLSRSTTPSPLFTPLRALMRTHSSPAGSSSSSSSLSSSSMTSATATSTTPPATTSSTTALATTTASTTATRLAALADSLTYVWDAMSLPPPSAMPPVLPSFLPLLPPRRKKHTLVLDLDETLVHTTSTPIPVFDCLVDIHTRTTSRCFYILKRPFLDTFLLTLSSYYHLVIFTASVRRYADAVIDLIDTHGCIERRYFRSSCTQTEDQMLIKDLSKVGNDRRRMVLVDNSPIAYSMNEDNAVPIDTWYEDQTDTQLRDLIPFLIALHNVDDVRTVLKRRKAGTHAAGYLPVSPCVASGVSSSSSSTSSSFATLASFASPFVTSPAMVS